MSIFDGQMKVIKKSKGDIIILEGYFGTNIYVTLLKMHSKQKLDAMFISIYPDRLEFRAYFTLEVYETLRAIYYWTESPMPNVSKKVIKAVMDKLKNTDYLRYMQHSDQDVTLIEDLRKRADSALDMSQIKKHMNFGILKHQVSVFKDYALMKLIGKLRGLLVAADPGTGKTFSSLALTLALKSDRIIILAPKNTLESAWVDSLTGDMFKEPQEYWISTSKDRYRGQKYIICHYEFVGKLSKMISNDGGNTAIIIDETHNLNEKNTKRTNALSEVLNDLDPSDVILLSGTAIKGKTLEVSNMLKFCDATFTPEIEEAFEELYKTPNYLLAKIIPKRYSYVETFVSKDDMDLKESITIEEQIKLKNGKYYTLEAITERMKDYALEQNKHYTENMNSYRERYDTLIKKALKPALASKLTTEKDYVVYLTNFEEIIHRYNNGGLMDIPEVMQEVNEYEKSVISSQLKGAELKDGLLKVSLERIVPETKKPKVINIK
jgi:Rad3-related DNA helicase